MPRTKVNIVQDINYPVEKEVLALAITKLSDTATKLLASGLNERAIVVLLQDATGIPKKKIQLVLNALGQLRSDYCHD